VKPDWLGLSIRFGLASFEIPGFLVGSSRCRQRVVHNEKMFLLRRRKF
jgi:hypothetical protein